jgi:hypothetical protein
VATVPAAKRPRGARAGRTTAAAQAHPSADTALARIEKDVLAAVTNVRSARGRRLTRMVRMTGGWMIFGVGVVFVILPVIPGMPLVVLAAFILAPDVPVFARVRDWSKSRFSHVTTGITDVNERFTEDFHRRFTR